MNKKLYIAGGLIASVLATSAFANKGGKPNSGISLGIQGGYVSHNGDLRTNTVLANDNSSTDLNGNSGSIGLFLSYGMMLNPTFYGGMEVFGQYQSAKGQQQNLATVNTVFKVDVTMKESYGAALKLGMLFKKDILTYVKLGAVSTKFDMTTTQTLRTGVSKGNRKTGFLAGLGAQVPLHNNWFIGAEYDYSWYGNISINASDDNKNSTYKPRVSNITLRLGYTF